MTATLYLVRHGQTDANKTRQVQGQTDTPLNATGQAQARALGRYLAPRVRFSSALSSPLARARETAALILEAQAAPPPLLTDPRLMERHFGAFEGHAFGALAADRGMDRGALYDETPDGGESLIAVMARACAALDAFAEGAVDDVLMVAHGGVIGALVCHLLGMPYRSASLRRFRRENTGVTRIALGDTPAVLTLNDTSHLHGVAL